MIYLDNNAWTFLDPKMLHFVQQNFSYDSGYYGNPSAIYQLGQHSKGLFLLVADAICQYLNFPGEVIFTAGATEGLNLCIENICSDAHVITSSLEHPAIIEPLKHSSLMVSYLDPRHGSCVVDVDQIASAYTTNTKAIVIGWANSETGACVDLEAIACFARTKQLLLIVDATGIVGKETVRVPDGVSAVVFSGHKIHAISGIGVVVYQKSWKLKPRVLGGGQQRGIRSGTEHVMGVASLYYILQQLLQNQDAIACQMRELRDYFESQILRYYPEAIIHCYEQKRVSNTSTISFPPLEGEVLQAALDLEGVVCGYGSACSSGSTTAFKSLPTMGVPDEIAASTLRFSLSKFTTREEIDHALQVLLRLISDMRQEYC